MPGASRAGVSRYHLYVVRSFGALLVAGGLGHAIGVGHHLAATGLPSAARLWFLASVGLAQLAGGAVYLAAARWARGGDRRAGALAAVGAAAVGLLAVCDLPILWGAGWFLRLGPILHFSGAVGVGAVAARWFVSDEAAAPGPSRS